MRRKRNKGETANGAAGGGEATGAGDTVERVLKHRDGVPGATGPATTCYNVEDRGDPNDVNLVAGGGRRALSKVGKNVSSKRNSCSALAIGRHARVPVSHKVGRLVPSSQHMGIGALLAGDERRRS